jgi:hypothetical protein
LIETHRQLLEKVAASIIASVATVNLRWANGMMELWSDPVRSSGISRFEHVSRCKSLVGML